MKDFRKSALLRLLSILSKNEFSRLGKFLRSPFFNQADPPRLLYRALKTHHPAFDHPKLSPEGLWLKVYPKRPFVEQHFWRMSSNLSKLVEKFLVHLEAEREKERLLVRNLSRREDYELFEGKATSVLSKLRSEQEDVQRSEIDMLSLLYEHPARYRYDPTDTMAEELMSDLDELYFREKLRLSILLLSRQRLYKSSYRIQLLDSIQHLDIPQSPIIQLYLWGIELLNGKEENLHNYYALLKRILSKLSMNEQRMLFYNGLNFCVRKRNRGELEYIEKVCEWYKFGDEHAILVYQNKISVATVINLVTNALIIGESEWGENFAERNIGYVDSTLREGVRLFTKGMIRFYKGDYEEAIFLLSGVDQLNFGYRLTVRSFIAQASFMSFLNDNTDYTVLSARLTSTEVFLYRHSEATEILKEPFINCLKILKTMASMKNARSSNSEMLVYLEEELKKAYPLIAKAWFSEFVKQGSFF